MFIQYFPWLRLISSRLVVTTGWYRSCSCVSPGVFNFVIRGFSQLSYAQHFVGPGTRPPLRSYHAILKSYLHQSPTSRSGLGRGCAESKMTMTMLNP